MHAQFLLTAIAFGFAAIMAALTAKGVLPGPTAVIDAWSATRPTVPRWCLAAAFWSNLLLPIAACGIYVGTTGQFLPAFWNDVAQLFLWLAMTIDAVLAQRRLLLAVSVIFLTFSIYEVTTHL